MQRIIKLICLLLILILALCGCPNPGYEARKPNNQTPSKWKSEDGTIQFEVKIPYSKDTVETIDGSTVIVQDLIYPILGTMIVNGETIEFCVSMGLGSSGMTIYPPEYIEADCFDNAYYEDLECSFKSKRHFVAVVTDGTYLEEGQKIHFYRTYPV